MTSYSLRLFSLLAAAALAATAVTAHIQLVMPPAINSKFDPQTPEAKIDYSSESTMIIKLRFCLRGTGNL